MKERNFDGTTREFQKWKKTIYGLTRRLDRGRARGVSHTSPPRAMGGFNGERARAHETTDRRAARRAQDADAGADALAAGAANGADEIVPPRGPSAEPDFAPSASAAAPVVRRADSAKARDARARYLERKRRKESAKRGG